MSVRLEHGDCLTVLRTLEDNSVDSVCTDPPAGISFMGKEWDGDKGGRDQWVAWLTEVMKECLRVLKPGGHALVWSLPRTSHWTAWAVESAGFEIRDSVAHMFATGFPKSLDISKAIDKSAGAERPVVGTYVARGFSTTSPTNDGRNQWAAGEVVDKVGTRTAPATAEAKKYDGWGTALKPAREDWILARKPLIGTVAENVLTHGTGGLNIDGCRVAGPPSQGGDRGTSFGLYNDDSWEPIPMSIDRSMSAGRWPAHLVLSHHDDCELRGHKEVATGTAYEPEGRLKKSSIYGKDRARGREFGYGENGKETVEDWECVADCPVKLLDEQSAPKMHGAGKARPPNVSRFGDSGGASRFFYQAKAATGERNKGCENLFWDEDGKPISKEEWEALPQEKRRQGNIHATVKSIALMRWLTRLITPKGGVCLDPFAGSGTTAIACMQEGFSFVGAELDEAHYLIAKARTDRWAKEVPQASERREAKGKRKAEPEATKAAAPTPFGRRAG